MRRWLRQHRYAISVAVRRLLAQPFSSLANLLVISLTLTVPILGAAILITAQPVARQLSVSPEMTVFLSPGADAKAGAELAQTLKAEHGNDIATISVVGRDEALKKLRSNPNWTQALAALPSNPLPDAVIVTLHDHPDLARHADNLATQWRRLPQVDLVQHDSAWVQRLEAILSFARIGLLLLAIGVALVVLATVFNTVRMQALTQREEIGVARLVGATESFVRRPFLYLGALTGLTAGLAAIVLAYLALMPLNAALMRLARSYGTELTLRLPDAASLLLAVVVVAILGALSARWSVTRNTRF
ncbi:MAG TPA: ABC transporter permease [Pusillimonas sp.]|uniref:cell division protein FtsX n=1 Tax=Pusillimonas sp. TaxID=3040095 RepID=UPI002BBDAEE5|nr:ABC transporter permease [Pusillimonas sp.]HUH88983.1 ABC transporter permease [Pusillimonas sp.]